MSQTIDLTLDGLSCGHCVKRVKESLEQRPDVELADVTVTEAHVTGTASADALIETIKQAGYGATLSHPKAKPLTESSIPSEALAAVPHELPVATADEESQQLLLSGMSCASCVTRVQHALQSVPGVTQARVNLAERTALVMGSASAADLVQAVEKAGYGAEAIEDDIKRRERQQETAIATMKRFRWQAIVALAVGIPVMVWGMIGDNMMVTGDNRSKKAKATAFMPAPSSRTAASCSAPARWAVIPRCHALFAWYARRRAVNRKLANWPIKSPRYSFPSSWPLRCSAPLSGISSDRRRKLFIRWSSPPPY